MMEVCKGRLLGIGVAVAHGVFSGSLNILLKFLISSYHFNYLTLIQFLTSSTAAVTLEVLRRLGKVDIPPFSLQLAKVFGSVCVLSTLQSTLTLWSLRGLSLPMYVVFKRCLPLATLGIGVCVLKNGNPSIGVVTAVIITTGGAALAGAGDLTGDPFGYVTGVLAVVIHASYLVLIQKTSSDSAYGPLTAQYAIAVMATPVLLLCSLVSMDAVHMWTYPGWSDPYISGIFTLCVAIGCAMNFTTLQCTYINSAVTTSFVGVLKSVATITVGMLAFADVAPTRLFIAGVVVNTVGSVTYCVVKYYETRRKSLYQDLEEAGEDGSLAGQPHHDKSPLEHQGGGAGGGAGGGGGGDTEQTVGGGGGGTEEAQGGGGGTEEAQGGGGGGGMEPSLANGSALAGGGGGGGAGVMSEQEVVEMQREHLHRQSAPPSSSSRASLPSVLRAVRNLQLPKEDTLIDNMEEQSP